ncbi:HesA/MoeB/ThiF family protein [Shewanella surugensis]|uniref:HesA/MoeB/ThiF family protein n=1 Tax=Shewanella surugensis TaxID=212020 RepID=A0ABT0LF55_9GAMM|nr:HesA/MoeB/ThiF family protein [Shewanella surugensis]MCL1126334.1 HesA/MoeB/ThiF family protein [Shewanella surugensis]
MSQHKRIKSELAPTDFIRYSRQVLLPEVGEAGQCQLQACHVVVVGIGGLGHLAAQYLAAAGVGQLTLIDGDKVEVSNLPRQLLFTDEDIGQSKARCAQIKLQRAYVDCHIQAMDHYLDEPSVDNESIDKASTQASAQISARISEQAPMQSTLSNADLVLDCTDNFATRHLVNRLCIQAGVSLISASAAHFQGQLLKVDLTGSPKAGCYHCLFPNDMTVSQSCSSVGVLGPMVGVMASMQALLALNSLLDVAQQAAVPAAAQLFRLNGKTLQWCVAKRQRDLSCPVCSPVCLTHAATHVVNNGAAHKGASQDSSQKQVPVKSAAIKDRSA